MATKKTTQTLGAAAGEPQGYPYPGTIAGRKFVFEELTIRAIRQFEAINAQDDKTEKGNGVIDMVFDLLTGPKVTVTEGEPFTSENVDELGIKDISPLIRFFLNPRSTLEELTAPAKDDEDEAEDDPKVA